MFGNGGSWPELFLRFIFISLSASAFYSLLNSFKLYNKVFINNPEEPLNNTEQTRLDLLLASAKKAYNFSFIISGLALLLSSLDTFTSYQLPYGELRIPKEQTALGLFFLVVFLLIYTDRLFLMALPWIKLDKRRPPYDWVVLGLSFEKNIHLGFWLAIPLFLISFSSGLILGNELKGWGIAFFQVAGLGFVYSPRVIYYLHYLINDKLDHRGGMVTLSMYLLYIYRLIRQYLYFFFFFYPLSIIIPNWKANSADIFFTYITVFWGVLYILRMLGGTKKVYRWVDKIGKRFGFAIVSQHYK